MIGHRELEVFDLFIFVEQRKGFKNVIQSKLFKEIGAQLKLPPTVTNAGYILRTKYEQLIFPFDTVLRAEFYPDSPVVNKDLLGYRAYNLVPPPLHAAAPPGAPPAASQLPQFSAPSGALSLPPPEALAAGFSVPPPAPRAVAGTRRPGAEEAEADVSMPCPGCGAHVPLKELQLHLYDCNRDFYIEMYGVTPPGLSAASKENALASVQLSPNLLTQNVFPVARSGIFDIGGTAEVMELIRHLSMKESRKKAKGARQKAEVTSAYASLSLPRKTHRVPDELAAAVAFPPQYLHLRRMPYTEGAKKKTPKSLPWELGRINENETATCSFRALQPVLEYLLIGAAPFQHSIKQECSGGGEVKPLVVPAARKGSEEVARNLLESIPTSIIPAVVRAWPLSTLRLVNVLCLCDEILEVLELSSKTTALEIDSPSCHAAGVAWPAARSSLLKELLISNWTTFTTDALGKALEAYPRLETLRIHPAYEVPSWPEKIRSQARAWHSRRASLHPEQCPSFDSEFFFAGQFLRDLTLVHVHPFFNIGMIAESAPNVRVLRVAYKDQSTFFPALNVLEQTHNYALHEYRKAHTAFIRKESEQEMQASQNVLALLDGGVESLTAGGPDIVFPLESDTNFPQVFSTSIQHSAPPPLEPTLCQAFPGFEPEFYGVAPLKHLKYLQIEGPVVVDTNLLSDWAPNVQELVLVQLTIHPFRIANMLARLSDEERAQFRRSTPTRNSFHMPLGAINAPHLEPLPEQSSPRFSLDEIIRIFFKKARRIGIQECLGNFFNNHGVSTRSFTEIRLDASDTEEPQDDEIE
eukprot:gnl/Chilomastix_cuspidata/2490.p1 GENE.gnl/Chilomastix_cuspidata/2490~~gnl/Chilomastix_cuspidata/2490.p1  ORF type:complete len:874 (+),score=346.97 gnl/Chilomastix_cuspidata/2490:198-2624(+)